MESIKLERAGFTVVACVPPGADRFAIVQGAEAELSAMIEKKRKEDLLVQSTTTGKRRSEADLTRTAVKEKKEKKKPRPSKVEKDDPSDEGESIFLSEGTEEEAEDVPEKLKRFCKTHPDDVGKSSVEGGDSTDDSDESGSSSPKAAKKHHRRIPSSSSSDSSDATDSSAEIESDSEADRLRKVAAKHTMAWRMYEMARFPKVMKAAKKRSHGIHPALESTWQTHLRRLRNIAYFLETGNSSFLPIK